METPKYEYLMIVTDSPHISQTNVDSFNKLGQEGWDLVSSVGVPWETGGLRQVLHYFKRPLIQKIPWICVVCNGHGQHKEDCPDKHK